MARTFDKSFTAGIRAMDGWMMLLMEISYSDPRSLANDTFLHQQYQSVRSAIRAYEESDGMALQANGFEMYLRGLQRQRPQILDKEELGTLVHARCMGHLGRALTGKGSERSASMLFKKEIPRVNYDESTDERTATFESCIDFLRRHAIFERQGIEETRAEYLRAILVDVEPPAPLRIESKNASSPESASSPH